MILAFALALTAGTPVDTLARSMEDYTECLRVNAGRPDREAASERARFAMAECAHRREATIGLGIELLSTRFGSEGARERTEQVIASVEDLFPAILRAGGGVEIPRPIAPMVRRYVDCLKAQIEGREAMPTDHQTYRAAVEASITACATVRTNAVAESEALLSRSPGFGEAGDRRAAINRAFDQTDSQQRNLPELLDTILRERGANASN